MLLLLSFLLSRRAGTWAIPIFSPSSPEAPTQDPSFDVTTTASTGAIAGRTLWDILWGCLATTFTCTWVSVHPNVPFLSESKTRSWRVYLTLVSLFAPEIMILWASKQFHGALVIMTTVNSSFRKVEKEVENDQETGTKSVSQDAEKVEKTAKASKHKEKENSPLWTLTHAQYLQMGGYRLQCLTSEERIFPSRYGRHAKAMFAGGERDVWELPLSFETMKAAFNKGYIDIPFIRKEEILEKNGRDALSRTIAILQLTWFIIQIAARIRQNLAVTELELTTAVLASLNIVMYVLWWSKPTDIQFPTIIMTKALEIQDQRWMRNAPLPSSPREPTRHADEAHDISPPPDLVMHYVIDQVGDMERVNFATHYWDEFTKSLRSSLIFIAKSPAKLVTGIFGPAPQLGVRIRGIWASPSHHNSASDHKSSSDHNSATSGSHSSSPSTASETNPRTSFVKKVRETISLIWRIIAYLFQALVYYPTLATLGSGRKSKFRPRSNTDSGEKHKNITVKDVEDKTTIQLIFNKHALRFVLGMVFFCEDVVNAPFAFLSAFSGAIFGMIHCLAWHFEFPSHVEQIVWRASSSIITGLCIVIMSVVIAYIINQALSPKSKEEAAEKSESPDKRSSSEAPLRSKPTPSTSLDDKISSKIIEIACSVIAICFVLARFSLLTLSIIELRSLPASAFDTVQWSGFIPHI